MKRIFALLLCLALTAGLFAGCNPGEQKPSVLQSFSNSLTTSGYDIITTTNPDGTTTVELVPPDASTAPSVTPSTGSQQNTSKPTVNSSSVSSVQPSTTQPGDPVGPGDVTGQPTSTVTVPQVTTDPVVLKLPQAYLMLTAIGASYNISPTDIPAAAIHWISENEAVAVVKNGIVTAKGMGTVRIIAIYQGQTAYCTVNVQLPTTDPTEPPVLELNPPTLSLTVGQILQYNTYDICGIAPEQITWSSSDPQIVSVSNGLVTALKPGTAYIHAVYGNQKASAHVVVKEAAAPEVEITLTHRYLTLLVGGSMNIYTGNVPVEEVTWVNTDPQVVSLQNGVVTALKPGQTILRAIYKDKSAFCTVTVQQVTTDPTTVPPTVTTTKPTTTQTTVTTTAAPASHSTLSYTKRYIYNLLSSQEQGWYRAIDTAVNNLENDVKLTGNFSDPKWYTIYFAYMFDNPEHFYLGAKVAYSSTGKLLFSYSDGKSNSYHGGEEKGDLSSLTDTMRQNIRSRKAAFDAEVAKIIAAVPVNIPDVEKELMLYDRLLVDMHYNQSAVWDYVAEPNWNAYGGIINKTGVCEAYAEAFQTLCYAVGINCTGVVGTAKGGGHKWNAVFIGGDWYQCDVTFDDPVNGRPGVAQFHSYFNITSAKMLTDHAITDSDYPGPTCTATKYSYKTYFG